MAGLKDILSLFFGGLGGWYLQVKRATPSNRFGFHFQGIGCESGVKLHVRFALRYCTGPVTAKALPRKVRVVRTFIETLFFFFQKQESLYSV